MGKIDLLELQSRCKRDPAGYREDFLMQLEHFNALHAVFSSSSSHVGTGVSSSKDHENFGDLVSFISHVHTVYKSESSWFPSLLLALIDQHFHEIGCFAPTKVGGGFDFTEKPKLRFGEPSVADFF